MGSFYATIRLIGAFCRSTVVCENPAVLLTNSFTLSFIIVQAKVVITLKTLRFFPGMGRSILLLQS
jgi:hypothetical protein